MKSVSAIGTGSRIYVARLASWAATVEALLDRAGLIPALQNVPRILIKPNLVEPLAPPITTPVDLIEALVDYLAARLPEAELIVGEGIGAMDCDTMHCFATLGYQKLAQRKGVRLLDLNEAQLVRRENPKCFRWPEMYLPRIVFESFLISVPVLKAHTLAGVTLTMKNMMGLAPPRHYTQGGYWKKSAFHAGIQEAIADLNRYRTPDFTLLDATVGMQEAHLWGPTCQPPPNLLVAGFDPVAVDAYGAHILKKDWRRIGHIRQVHGELGTAEGYQVISGDGCAAS